VELITGKKRNIPTANRMQALEEHVGVLLVAFTYHKGGHEAPCRCESDPHPGIAIQREYFLGHGQMRFFLTRHWFRLMSDPHEQFCWTTRLCRVMLLRRGTSLS
jgi:hypothetical protein